MNKNKLKAVMIEHCDTVEKLSESLGITKSTFSKKLNEHSNAGFTQPEILLIKKRYDLNPEEVCSIFFD